MNVKFRKIDVDPETADLLEARATARGITVSELVADLAGTTETLPAALAAMRDAGRGPWAPEILADDARRLAAFKETGEGVPWPKVRAWLKSWGTENELPPPKSNRS